MDCQLFINKVTIGYAAAAFCALYLLSSGCIVYAITAWHNMLSELERLARPALPIYMHSLHMGMLIFSNRAAVLGEKQN